MLQYTVHRLLLVIPTLIAVAMLVFFLVRVVPGDVIEVKLTGEFGDVTPEQIYKERVRLGLEDPLSIQFVKFMVGLPQGDLGISLVTERPVMHEIGGRIGISIELAAYATILSVLIAFPLGTLAALYRGSWFDYLIRIVTIGGLAVPSFWFGMLIIMALLAFVGTLPSLDTKSIFEEPLANLYTLLWPALSVGYRYAAVTARMLRSSILEVLSEDYIRTARAKGLFERVVIVKHGLRNALLPTVTVVGLEFAFLIGGLVVTEQVFNINGIGKLFVEAVQFNDLTMLQGLVLVVATSFVLINVVVDLLYATLDPRIRYNG
jgi:peptide/nickel transport system permease protein